MDTKKTTAKKSKPLSFSITPQNRKEEILIAALSIISKFGLQGLNYRLIADEAKVPLGSTTYYFSSIYDIQVASYELFQRLTQHNTDELSGSSYKSLRKYLKSTDPDEKKKKKFISALVKHHLHYFGILVGEEMYLRRIEAAFLHAAMVDPSIGKLLSERQQIFIDICTEWFDLLGLDKPQSVAIIYVGFLNQVERKYTLDHEATFNATDIKSDIEFMFEKIFT